MWDRASNVQSVVLSGVLIASLAAVAAALVSQYQFDMPPCAWCVLQRLIFVLIAAVAGIGLLLRGPRLRAGAGVVIGLLAGSGIASALYQHFVAAASSSCRRSLAEKIMGYLQLDSFAAPLFAIRATCAEAAATLLGLPYEFWSLALFVIFVAGAAVVVVRGFRTAHGR
jgi:disulfide bond formation protein DsbB